MYHSITFGDGSLYPSGHEKEGQFMGTNTWDDWHLIPSERPSIASPGVATSFVEIPGRDGSIDLSMFLANRPVYADRSGSFDFYVDNDHEYWETIRMKIMSFLHGKRMKIVLEDDPEWYWEGRFAVDNWRSEPSNSRIAINYQVGPFKKRIRSDGDQDVVWDTFNFENGYDYFAELNAMELTGTEKTVHFVGYEYPFKVYIDVVPASGSTITARLNGGTVVTATSSGTMVVGKAAVGINTLVFTGTGTATVHFVGGSL